jgi:flagellar protein FliS
MKESTCMDAQLATRNARYLEDTIATAPPSKLLTLLYDRLVKDLGMAEQAIAVGDRSTADDTIAHARDIITELLTTLDGSVWTGAVQLGSLYAWMLSELIAAGIHGDAGKVADVRTQVDDLRTAWHEAAQQLSPQGIFG